MVCPRRIWAGDPRLAVIRIAGHCRPSAIRTGYRRPDAVVFLRRRSVRPICGRHDFAGLSSASCRWRFGRFPASEQNHRRAAGGLGLHGVELGTATGTWKRRATASVSPRRATWRRYEERGGRRGASGEHGLARSQGHLQPQPSASRGSRPRSVWIQALELLKGAFCRRRVLQTDGVSTRPFLEGFSYPRRSRNGRVLGDQRRRDHRRYVADRLRLGAPGRPPAARSR